MRLCTSARGTPGVTAPARVVSVHVRQGGIQKFDVPTEDTDVAVIFRKARRPPDTGRTDTPPSSHPHHPRPPASSRRRF